MTERPEQSDASEKKHVQQPAAVAQDTQPERQNNDRVDSMRDANNDGARTALKDIDGSNPFTITGLDDGGGGADATTRRLHTVKKGESLWSISRDEQRADGLRPGGKDVQNGIEEIKRNNPGLKDKLTIGQQIDVPTPMEVKPGDVTQFGTHKPGQRAALVIDDRTDHAGLAGPKPNVDVTHGGLLDAGFNAMGFNVFQMGDQSARPIGGDRFDWSVPMSKAADFVAKNPDKFPPGSFVNVSLGNPGQGDPTYADVNRMTGMNLNPGNVKENRDELLTRLQRVADGQDPVTGKPNPNSNERDREIAGVAVRTNAAIDRLQKAGVEVIHSAGNSGADRLDINFLKSTEIAAVGPDGNPIPASAIPNHASREFSSVVFNKTGPNEASTEIAGRILRFPLTPEGRAFGDKDHEIAFTQLGAPGATYESMFPVAKVGQGFDTKSLSLGFAQNIYGQLGPRIDHASGTSFGVLNYVFRSRNVGQVFTP